MSMTDPVADMLTRIRNACAAGHRRVDMPVSKLKSRAGAAAARQPLHRGLQDPGRRRARRAAAVPQVPQRIAGHPGAQAGVDAGPPALRQVARDSAGQERLGMAIVSTPQGLMSDRDARTRTSAASSSPWSGRRPMSRIGKKPITLPKGVRIELTANTVAVKGPKGELRRTLHARHDPGTGRRHVHRSSGPSEEKRTRRCTA